MAEDKEVGIKNEDRWKTEIKAAEKRQKDFWKAGDAVVGRFLDERDAADEGKEEIQFRINLFYANVYTLMCLLFGRVPKTDVSRKWADPNDDVSRVASEMLKRILDNQISDPGSLDSDLLKACLQDRLLPGLGVARIRYEFKKDEFDVMVSAWDELEQKIKYTTEKQSIVTDERAPLDYVHWRDFLWGYGRIWADVPWVGFKVYVD